jgi:hypothetical protein
VEKDIRERLHAKDKENVFNRTSHAWTQFPNHPELGFIDVDFLQSYREKRIRIINKHIEDARNEEIMLSKDQLGNNEETVLNKDAIQPIQTLMRKHCSWHPFKFSSTMPLLDNGSPLTSRYCWLRQAKEMHDLCRVHKEGYVWEYLWNNWYRWEKWELWARSACLNYYPTIQTNAAVKTHWNSLKNFDLLWFNNPRIDLLCAQMFQTFLPKRYLKIRQHRKGLNAAPWHKSIVNEWKSLEEKIMEEDERDIRSDHPNAQQQRRQQMDEMHHTSVKLWRCQCYAFNHSAYHLCSHLIQLYNKPYPLKGEAERQHTPPLLWIVGEHDAEQRFRRGEAIDSRGPVEPASLERLGIDMSLLVAMEDQFEDEEEEDLSRIEQKKKEYLLWLKSLEKAIEYTKEEMR